MQNKFQKNSQNIRKVFDKVFNKYDLMNDIMSFGAHRIWKQNLINILKPSKNKSLIDVASGTGDIAKLFYSATDGKSKIFCVEPNINMLREGKKKLAKFKEIKWKLAPAENLGFNDETFDFYTISFGLRNTSNINRSISEAYRVLKKGGKFICLEFSKVDNENLEQVYKQYSKLIPKIGKIVVGDSKPYQYLVDSINKFINQEQLLSLMKKNKFVNCKYRNIIGGVVAIHYGWKV